MEQQQHQKLARTPGKTGQHQWPNVFFINHLGPTAENDEFKLRLNTYVTEAAAKKRDKKQKEDLGEFYYCLK